MTVLGYPVETIYLVVLIAAGVATLLYVLFGDVLEGAGEISAFLNPVLILAFITFFSAGAYIMEMSTSLHSLVIVLVAAVIAILLDSILNIFVLIPMSSAEQSLSYTEKSLEGRIGKVIIPIPENGFGEVVIDSYSGKISKPAAGLENQAIHEGEEILVIDVQEGVLKVIPYEKSF